jgi:hypothetical protein
MPERLLPFLGQQQEEQATVRHPRLDIHWIDDGQEQKCAVCWEIFFCSMSLSGAMAPRPSGPVARHKRVRYNREVWNISSHLWLGALLIEPGLCKSDEAS